MTRRTILNRGRRGARLSVRTNGFTLMELLIVMAIIAILMLIAIPTMGNMKRYANETSAIQSVRAINMAQSQYEATYPANGYSCALQALGGDPKSGAPSPTNAEVLQLDLATGIKSGYSFSIGNCTKVNNNGTDRITGYTVVATPLTVGSTGNRSFCSDQFGGIKYDPTGGTNCSQNLSQ